MKIKAVHANNRKKEFVVTTQKGTLSFPYAVADLKPTPEDKIVELYIDDELGREAFTFVLESGLDDSVHIDHVLHYNRDPDYLHNLLIHRLSAEAKRMVGESKLSKREIIRRLGTSPSQLYRILDTTYYGKTVDQILKLFHVLQCEVEVKVTPKSA